MINCPKCQVPNPDNASACAACGTPLVGQQFAQALDQALSPQPPGQQPPPPAPAPPPETAPAQPQAPLAAPGEQPAQQAYAPPEASFATDPSMGYPPLGGAADPNLAQAEINKFIAEQRALKRTKGLVYASIGVAAALVIGFFMLQSAREKARVEEVAKFFMAFRNVDDEDVANFWKCTVRAKQRDVRLASDTLEITEGLEKAFSNFPKSQPDWLKDKCLPLIDLTVEEFDKLKPPSDFADPLEGVKASLREVKLTFGKYANKIGERKQEAANEQAIRDANTEFHTAMENKESDKAIGYYNFLDCAIPELEKKLRTINKPPDTQPVVEYIYNTCKDDTSYAKKLSGECFPQLENTTDNVAKAKRAIYKMSGDARDQEAINHCFRQANKGFAAAEYEEIAKVFVKYRNARGKILEIVGKMKEQSKE